jgi:hypothetical protein
VTEFWAEALKTAVSVGLVALIVRYFLLRAWTHLPVKHLAFAFAAGVLVGRQQTYLVRGLEELGSAVGGLVVLGMLWLLWFKRSPLEAKSG